MRKYVLIVMFGVLILNLNAQNVPSNSITISALPSYGWLKYHKADIHSKGNFDLGVGLTFRHQFSENWQFSIGVNYRKYHGSIDYNGLIDSAHLSTTDPLYGEQKYFLSQIFNSTEAQTVTYIEPNIRLEYVKSLTSAIDFIGGVGLAYGINIAETNQMTSGSYRRYAWYYENHNLIENLPSMNLGTYPYFLNPLQGKTFKHSLFAIGEVGFRFKLSTKWQMITMLNIQYSLLNIQAKQDIFTHHWSYSGIAASEIPQGVRAISAGLEIGFSYRFEKSQKMPRMHGVHCPY